MHRLAAPGLCARLFVAFVVTAGAVHAQDDPYLEDVRAAERYADSGKRSRARSIFEEILADAEDFGVGGEGPGQAIVRRARLGILELDLVAGEYRAILDAVAELGPAEAGTPAIQDLVAKAHTAVGEYEKAIEIYRAHVELPERKLEGRYRLGVLLEETGKREAAREQWEAIVNQSRSESARDPMDLTWIGRAHLALGGRANYEAASSMLSDAIRTAPKLVAPRIEYGWLRYLAYGEASGFESGEGLLKDVLDDVGDHEDALLRLFEIRSANMMLNGAKTREYLDRALTLNPNSVKAKRLLGVELLDDRRFEEAAQVLDEALQINPRDKRTLAERAAAAHLQGDAELEFDLRARAMAVDPDFAGLDHALGERLAALYRFADSVPAFERALERAPKDVAIMQGLARSCIYTGQGARARVLLQEAEQIESGLVDPWRTNMLAIEALLADEYETIETDGFVFRIHREDRAVLQEYLIPYHAEARETLGEKYGIKPEKPVTVEVLRTWDDFSVRTIGFRGFTALGACFGGLVTLVSPVDNDLRKNDFMWSATVWHEYAHVLTLALSNARVPRWLTEGISVYEERVRNRAWERGMQRDLLDAYHNGEIPPVRLLNRLFRGPRILFGYMQGGLIVEFLAREHGFDKVIQMLRLYGADVAQEEIFQEAFGLSTREFDKQFLDYVVNEKIDGLRIVPRWNERAVERLYDRLSRKPDDLEAHLALAWSMLQREIRVDAANHLRQALKLAPDNAEAQLVHAELLRQSQKYDEAAAAYERGFKGGADDFESRIRYGKLLESREQLDDAARQYLAAKRCWPRCTEQSVAPPVLLARLYNAQGRRAEAMMELKMFCSLTARAFQPRLTLAAWDAEAGNHEAAAKLLDEAIQIDPFMRSVHVRYADVLLELGRKADAAREFRVALAIPPHVDREYLGAEAPPSVDSPEFRESQAAICVRLAQVLKQIGDTRGALDALDRAEREAGTTSSEAVNEARSLRELWR